MCLFFFVFFFFKQKTAYEMRISDWSSDVCSSDLNAFASAGGALQFDMVPVQAPTSAVTLSMGGADFDIAPAIAKWMPREKHTVKVPLSCFVERGADLGGVDVPFSVEAAAPFAASFTSIKIVAGAGEDADALDCGPTD